MLMDDNSKFTLLSCQQCNRIWAGTRYSLIFTVHEPPILDLKNMSYMVLLPGYWDRVDNHRGKINLCVKGPKQLKQLVNAEYSL